MTGRRTILVALAALAGVIAAGYFWLSQASGEQLRSYFNLIYRYPFGLFSPEPNQLLVDSASKLPPGRALDVAMGEGRNAIFLASRGWAVTGFDISDVALEQAATRAAKAGVRIQLALTTSEAFDYGESQWDLIVMSYAFAPIDDPGYIERLRRSLRPGGVIVFEHYVRIFRRPPLPQQGAPPPGQLPRIFAGFETLRYQEETTRGDWLFGRPAPLARLVAKKKQ